MAATTTRPPRRWLGVAGAALLLAGTSCGVSGNDDEDAATTTAEVSETTSTIAPTPAPDEPYGEEDCPTVDAVAEAAGFEVELTPWSGSNFAGDISTSSSGCSYSPPDAESIFDDQITISRLTTEAPLSARLFDVMDEAALADADENGFRHLDDLVDDAVLDGREVVVKAGDTMVWVEVEPDGGAEPGSDNPAIDLAGSVVALGLTADPAPTCDDVEDLVADEVGAVTNTIPHSGFIGVDDISITTSGCALELDDGTEVTIATSAADVWDDWVAASEDSSFTSSYEAVEVLGRRAFDDGDRLVIDDGTTEPGDSPFEIETTSTTLDEAQQAELRITLAQLALGG